MKTNEEQTPPWEKALGITGLLLLLSGIIYLGWAAINAEDTTPDVLFNIKKISPVSKGFLVEVEVTNTGAQSLASVYLEGHLRSDGETEISHTQLDYLPSRSMNYVGFFFSADPRAGALEFKPSGYQRP